MFVAQRWSALTPRNVQEALEICSVANALPLHLIDANEHTGLCCNFTPCRTFFHMVDYFSSLNILKYS